MARRPLRANGRNRSVPDKLLPPILRTAPAKHHPLAVGAHRHLRSAVEGCWHLGAVGFCGGLPRHGAYSGQHLGRGIRLANSCAGSTEHHVGAGDGSLFVSGERHILVLPTVFPRANPVRGGDVLGACLSALDSAIVDRLDPGDDVPRSYAGNVPGVDRPDLARDRGGGPWVLRPETPSLSTGAIKEIRMMFTKLTDTNKAAIFSVLVLIMAVVAGLVIRALGITSEFAAAALYMFTPAEAVLIMLLVITREGYSREGWKVLGLHRLGLSVWWIAFGVTLLITVAASVIVWATPLAFFAVPEQGIGGRLIGFVIQVLLFTFTFVLGEEVGWRGYLLPKLLSLGRRGALVLSGVVWATWHMPLILLTPIFPVGNKLISLPLFYATVVAASFVYGYLRLYTGSVWPASLAHAVHNAAWGILGVFTVTSYPIFVNKYLVGDFGVLILVGAVIGAVWLNRRLMKSGPDEPRPTVAGGQAPAV